MITGTTKLLGVIGYPISHSLSPVMHNAAIAHLQQDYVYLPLPVSPDRLEQALKGFEAIGLQGFSVTIPHKQMIMPLLDDISEVAQAIGAVNTVYRSDRGWSGTNTDVTGFVAPLLDLALDWQRSQAVILGNGGAARAVVAGCSQLGVAHIHVVGRDAGKLEAFRQSWLDAIDPPLSVHVWEDLPALLPKADLLVNSTPVGMYPKGDNSPLTDTEAAHLKPGAIAYDLIYTPRPTHFLRQASERGMKAIDGLEMLVEQGAAALELWLGCPAPVEVMRRSLLDRLTRF